MKFSVCRMLAGAVMALSATFSLAQNYPAQPIKWVVPFPAGGGTDVVARILSQFMSDDLKQPIIIDNKPGAGTMIGGDFVAKAKPDGYTIGTLDVSTVALAPHLYAKVPYKPEKDFTYVGGTNRFPFVLMANTSTVRAKTLGELLAYARQHPGALKYSTPGLGGPNHLGMELFQRKAGVKMLHVPYKGDAAAVQAVVAGEVDLYLGNTATSIQHVRTGRIHPIAASTQKRTAILPDLPTFAEAGVPDFESYAWQGIAVPAGTPPAIVARLNGALNKALANEEVKKKFSDLGLEASPSTPEEFGAFAASQSAMWGDVIRTVGIKLEE